LKLFRARCTEERENTDYVRKNIMPKSEEKKSAVIRESSSETNLFPEAK